MKAKCPVEISHQSSPNHTTRFHVAQIPLPHYTFSSASHPPKSLLSLYIQTPGWFREVILIMETTTTAAKASVAILQPEKKKKLKMMVCIDDSEESFYALKWSLDNLYCIAGLTAGPSQDGSDGCKLTIVHVQHPFQHFLFPAGPGAASE